MDELNRLSVDAFKDSDKSPLVILLDNIRSQHNIGSIFRTSDAFRIEKIVLCGITATPPNREIQKTALGSTESVQWEYEEDILTAIKKLKNDSYTIVAVEQATGSIPLHFFQPAVGQKVALIFGNEVMGVSEEAMAQVDACIEIPQFGTKHSMNVSVTAGIVIWDFFLKSLNPDTSV